MTHAKQEQARVKDAFKVLSMVLVLLKQTKRHKTYNLDS